MAQGTEKRRSGRITLPRGALSALAPSAWRPLCSINDDSGQAIARTVRVNVSRASSESDAFENVRLPAGVWWKRGASSAWIGGGTSQCNGVLRIEYGSQGVSRSLLCDLASGEFQIPSCEHIYVEAARYTPGSDASAIALLGLDGDTEVTAEISDGTSDDFTPMLLTAPSTWAPGAGIDALATVLVPRGAYAFELFADSPIGANNTFEVSPPGALRDFANSLYQPSGPLPVLGNVITVQARGASPVACRLVFTVR